MATPIAPARAPYAPPLDIAVHPSRPRFEDPQNAQKELVYVLDTETGVLHAERWDRTRYQESPNHRPPAYYANRDLWFVGDSDGRAGAEYWNRAPRLLGWNPDQYPRYVADAAGLDEALAAMIPAARVLLDALEPLPDGGYDWTLKATAAYERIAHIADYGRHGLHGPEGKDPGCPWHGAADAPLPARHHYGAVSFDEIVEADPSWADPRWAAMTDAQLDEVAAAVYHRWGASDLVKSIRGAEPKLKATIQFGKLFREDRDLADANQGVPLYPVGIRAGLRRFRANMIAAQSGMPVLDAGQHLAGKLPDKLVATTGDAELAELARLLTVQTAHGDKVALVGTVDYLARARGEMRLQVRAELAAIVAERRTVADRLAQLSARRASLLAAVAAFREEPEWPDDDAVEPNYAELGRLGGMSRQAALEALRPLFGGDDAEAVAEQAEVLRAEVLRWFRDNADDSRHKYGGVWAESVVSGVKGRPGVNVSRKLVDAALAALVDAGDLAVKDSRYRLVAGR